MRGIGGVPKSLLSSIPSNGDGGTAAWSSLLAQAFRHRLASLRDARLPPTVLLPSDAPALAVVHPSGSGNQLPAMQQISCSIPLTMSAPAGHCLVDGMTVGSELFNYIVTQITSMTAIPSGSETPLNNRMMPAC